MLLVKLRMNIQTCALALTRLILLKSINTDIVGFTQYAADDATPEQSLDDPGHTLVICLLAADTKLMNLKIFYNHREQELYNDKMFSLFEVNCKKL